MRPLLSIGIIFKNEIRCLGRCLESLRPLREAIPCELVVADTGSGDGSREIAEKDADILFDFPWIDDFSAARNAVMDRCSGEWFLSIDADEWLDENIEELVRFLQAGDKRAGDLCGVIVRNYATAALDWQYADFLAIRMVRMSTGLRYKGAVHEHLDREEDGMLLHPLRETILHHDGYVCLNDGSVEGEEKRRRNMRLLQKSLEASPEDLMLLIQCAESSGRDHQAALTYLRRAVELVRQRRGKWETCGPNALRLAVRSANKLRLPEAWEWTALAETLFPDSLHTAVEIQFDAAQRAWNDGDYPEVIRRGLRYLSAAADCRAGRFDVQDLIQSPVNASSWHHETSLRAYIARAQVYEGQPEAALVTLSRLDYDTLDGEQVEALLETMLCLQELSEADTAPLIREFWSGLTAPRPSPEAAGRRRDRFIAIAAGCFQADETEDRTANAKFVEIAGMRAALSGPKLCRRGYTLFRPLLGETEIGTAAVLMDEEDPEAAARLLAGVRTYEELPIRALSRVLVRGAAFPLPENPLNIEDMDSLAVRLTQDREALLKIITDAVKKGFAGSWQTLAWVRGLVLVAVQTWDWSERGDLDLARAFARVEGEFLPGYYVPELLREENLCVLPPLHRFGWYCSQAFQVLDAGDPVGYIQFLRKGLTQCPAMRPMAEYLLGRLEREQNTFASPEMLALAAQIRNILMSYPPNHPAVLALKRSPAYQRAAGLIEGEVRVPGL